jgi:hypothetical protein
MQGDIRTYRMAFVLSILLFASSTAPSCFFFGSEPERPNIVFIVLDTLRKDHLGPYG